MSRKRKHKKRIRAADRQEVGRGEPCPRCRQTTTRLEHTPAFKPPASAGYYRFWFRCDNRACKTTLIMPSEGYVKPDYAKRRVLERPTKSGDPLDDKLHDEAAALTAFTTNRL